MLIESKKCGRCKETKSVECFARCSQKGYQAFCNRCKAEHAKEAYRKKHLNDAIQAIQHPSYKIQWTSRQEAAAYLAGLIDGEGCVQGYNYSKTTKRTRLITISNTDPTIVEACMSACSMVDLTYSLRWYDYSSTNRSNTKPMAVVNIYGQENLQIIQDTVPLQCMQKKIKLMQTLATFEKFKPRKRANKPLNEGAIPPKKQLALGGEFV